jgi:hypothetical protein
VADTEIELKVSTAARPGRYAAQVHANFPDRSALPARMVEPVMNAWQGSTRADKDFVASSVREPGLRSQPHMAAG